MRYLTLRFISLFTLISLAGTTGPGICQTVGVQPDSLNISLDECFDTTWVSLQILNNGSAPLFYSVKQVSSFYEGFEDGLDRWEITAHWGLSPNAYAGSHSISESPGGFYGDGWNDYIQLKDSLVIVDEDSAWLSFYAQYSLECGFDYLYPQLSVNDGAWINLGELNCPATAWMQFAYDLSPYVSNGDFIRIRFYFHSDGSVDGQGTEVDEVRVTGVGNMAHWVYFPSPAGVVLPGETAGLDIAISSTGLISGSYLYLITLITNDPLVPELTVPVSLTFSGYPLLTLPEPLLEFGEVMEYTQRTDTLWLGNTGCDPLVIDTLYCSSLHFAPLLTTLTIPPGESAGIPFRFQPDSTGFFQSALYMATNDTSLDPEQPVATLTGTGTAAPLIGFSPGSISVTAACGDSTTATLVVHNYGLSDLFFQISGYAQDGLVLHYPFDGDANDLGPFHLHGTVMGPAPATDRNGNPGKALSFDGTNDFVDVPDGVYFSGNYTVTAWMNETSYKSWSRLFDFGNGPSADNVLGAASRGTTGAYLAEVYLGSTTGGQTYTSTALPLNNWHFICQVLEGNIHKIYVNGNLVKNGNATFQPGNILRTNNYIGKSNWIADYYFHGRLDDFRIYDRALSPAEVSDLYHSEFPDWLSLDLLADTVGPGDSIAINLKFNALNLTAGPYASLLSFWSNDPLHYQAGVPLSFLVTGDPTITADTGFLDFDSTVQHVPVNRNLVLSNTGCDTLHITSLAFSDPHFGSGNITAPHTVPPFSADTLIVIFLSADTGFYAATLEISSDAGQLTAGMQCYTGGAPHLFVSPDTATAIIQQCNDTVELEIQLYNQGLADLNWQLGDHPGGETALSFTASGQHVQVGNLGAMPATGTIEFWMKTNQLKNYNNCFTTSGTGNSNVGIRFEETSSGNFYVVVGNDQNSALSYYLTNSLQVGQWHHVAVSWDKNTNRLWTYFDGNVVSDGVSHNRWASQFSSVLIGTGYNSSRWWNGMIDEVRIWGFRLSSGDIPGVMHYSMIGTVPGLLACWNCNEGNGDTLHDITPNIHHGIFTGATWEPSDIPHINDITANPLSGVIQPGSSTPITLSFNGNGKNAGIYPSVILFTSDDPQNDLRLYPCLMTVEGEAQISADTTEFLFGEVLVGDTVYLPLIIYNTGCDTLESDSLPDPATADFSLAPFPFSVMPGDSGVIAVRFHPASTGFKEEWISLASNGGELFLTVQGTGNEPPVIDADPDALFATVYCASETQVPLTIYNNGLGELSIHIPPNGNPAAPITPAGCIPQTQDYCCEMGIYHVMFHTLNQVSGSASEGYQDFTSSVPAVLTPGNDYVLSVLTGEEYEENVAAWIDYNNDGDFSTEEQVMLSPGTSDPLHETWVSIPWDAVSGTPLRMRVMSDYIWQPDPQPCLNPEYGQAEDYPVLIASGLLVPEITETVPPLGSSTLMVTFSGASLPVGVYPSYLPVTTNDPMNPLLVIPTELTVEGSAEAEISETYVNFGEIMASTGAEHTIYIVNTGCADLETWEIISSNPVFAWSSPLYVLPPAYSLPVTLSFFPDGTGFFDAEIILVTNIGDFVIYVEGYGLAPPEIHVDPEVLYPSAECGQTSDFTFYIDNYGEGSLQYLISGFPELDSGLRMYCPFRGNPDDQSPSGRNLTNYGAFLTDGNTGVPENAYAYDNLAYMSYENESDIADNLFNQQFSVTLWAMIPEMYYWQDEQPCLFHLSNNSWDLEGVAIMVDQGMIRASVNIDYELFHLYCEMDTNQWMQLTLTYDGTNIRLFKNAMLQETVTATGYVYYNYDLPVLNLGTLEDYGFMEQFFTGALDEFRLYDRPLSETEILALYQHVNHSLEFTVVPEADTIDAFDWREITMTIHAEDLYSGNYEEVIGIVSNDPAQPVLWLPVYLEVTGTPVIEADPLCLLFDTVMQFSSQTLEVLVSNPSCATLFVWDISSSDPSFLPAFPNVVIPPFGSNTVPVTFSPQQEGDIAGFLYLDSEAGWIEICLSGFCTGIPSATVNPSAFNEILSCQVSVDLSIDLTNSGFAEMQYTIAEPSNVWFGGLEAGGILCAGCSTNLPFTLYRGGLSPGLYSHVIHINTDDPFNPVLEIPLYLLVPNPLVPVYLGADTGYCEGSFLELDAGNYAAYLWNDGSAGQYLVVSTPGTYSVEVIDDYDCPSSDTIVVIAFENPVALAGNDTAVCEGSPLLLIGNATGTQPPVPLEVTIGQASGYSSSTGPNPFGTYYMDHRSQYLYHSTELQEKGLNAGTILELGFILTGVGSPGLSGLNIRAGLTGQQTLTGFIGGLSTVYSTDYYLPVIGENVFTLQVPFYYDGVNNLVIEVCFNNNSWSSNSTFRYSWTTGCTFARYCDNCAPGCNLTGGTAYSERPDLVIHADGDLTTYAWTGPGGFTSAQMTALIPSIQPAGSGIYTLTVDNGYGCTGTDDFTISVEPRPQVEAGPDGDILGGESFTFLSSVTGGITPYSYTWSPATYLDDPTLPAPTSTPVFTTTYTFSVTGGNNCSASDQVTVNVIPRFSLSGHVTYDNSLYSALGNVLIRLLDQALAPLDSTLTDPSGNYLFPYLFEGSYRIEASTETEAGSINATDALVTGRHVVKLETLSGLPLTAADVNNSGAVTGGDALLILHRSVGNISTFSAGDWFFESRDFQISGINVTQDLMGICTGDVNTSYIPGLKPEPSVFLEKEGMIAAGDDSMFLLPVSLARGGWIGAFTLHLVFPGNTPLPDEVLAPAGQLATRADGNTLSVAWSNPDGICLDAHAALVKLRFSRSAAQPPGSMELSLSGHNEVADPAGDLILPALLTYPGLLSGEETLNGFYLGQNQPNPCTTATDIPFLLPETGTVTFELFDILGNRLLFKDLGELTAGRHQLPLRTVKFPAGVYSFRVTLQGEQQQASQSRLMIITK